MAHQTGKDKPMMANMPAHCMQMMQQQQKRTAMVNEQDMKLKGMMAQMEKASGEKKINLMGKVIQELVQQRDERQKMMGMNQTQMREHMKEHMQMGDKMPMKQCPMMGSGMGMGMGMKGMKK
jgi:hypothetical protein